MQQKTTLSKSAQNPRFVADVHLGRLALYLRMLGFDTRYGNDFRDEELGADVIRQRRILLSRDRQLVQRAGPEVGYLVREQDPGKQLAEVCARFDLKGRARPFSLCLRCNRLVVAVDKKDIEARLEPDTRKRFHRFFMCTKCGRIYWAGSHYERMKRFIERYL
ncbi:MAG TPA: hypothetical protein EYP57_05205 [Thermodesulfobacteriaceae bacterium]|nr:hypothetical protein [Thermodesulfobacteriaceae bacterium]